MVKDKGKKVVKPEDWCFVCYDGGKLLICAEKGCGKVYHPRCVGKKNSILKSEGRWTCGRHSCSSCRASPQFYCLCCPTAFCNLCDKIADFVPAKLDKGLCKACFELTQSCKENAEIKSKGGKIAIDEDVDMFNEYLEIIMEQEGLTFNDLCPAQLNSPNSVIIEEKDDMTFSDLCHAPLKSADSVMIEDKDVMTFIDLCPDPSKSPDYVMIEEKDARNTKSDVESVKNLSPTDLLPSKRKKTKIRGYDGRCSKALIDFLSSIGVVAPETLTRCHVDIKISKYILRENLFVGKEQEIVCCDEKLFSLFRKEQVQKNKIYDLLRTHFDSTLERSSESCSGNTDEEMGTESKSQRTLSSDKVHFVEKIYPSATAESRRKRKLSPDKVSLEEKVDYAVQTSDYSAITESKRQRKLSTNKASLEDKVDYPIQKRDYVSAAAKSKRHRILSSDEVALEEKVENAVQKSNSLATESKRQRTLSSDKVSFEDKGDYALQMSDSLAMTESKRHRALSSDKLSLEDKVDYAVQKSDSLAITELKRHRPLSTDIVLLEDKVDYPVQKTNYALAAAESERQITLSTDEVPIDEKVDFALQKSHYASIVVDNIKLVYLRRTLVEDLLKDPDNFKDKAVGSFVRLKRMQKDCSVNSSFQLLPVTGIKKTSNANINKEILLEVSCMPDDIPINMLNDDDISEEECLDLQQRMRDGILRKPTVLELQQKANILHEDITKHWIQRELVRLQKKIDYMHEKGRKNSLAKHLDEKEKLKKSSEQQRLLKKLPTVIAEEN